jgi:hypothetical protein
MDEEATLSFGSPLKPITAPINGLSERLIEDSPFSLDDFIHNAILDACAGALPLAKEMTTHPDHQLHEEGGELIIGDEAFDLSNYAFITTTAEDPSNLINAALDPFFPYSTNLNMLVDRNPAASPAQMFKMDPSMDSTSPKSLPRGLEITNLEPALRPGSTNPVLYPHLLEKDMLPPSKPLTPAPTSHPPPQNYNNSRPQARHQTTASSQTFPHLRQLASTPESQPVTLAPSPCIASSRRRSHSLPPGEVSFHRQSDSGDIIAIGQPVVGHMKRTGKGTKSPFVPSYHPYDNARKSRFMTPPPAGGLRGNETRMLSPKLGTVSSPLVDAGVPKGIQDLLRPTRFDEGTWALRSVLGGLTRGLEKVVWDARVEMADWLDGGDAVAM